MRRNTLRAAALAAALAFCGLALPGCPGDYGYHHDDDDGVSWVISFNSDLIPGDGNNGDGFTGIIVWDW